MHNLYMIFTGKNSFDDMIDKDEKAWLPFNIFEKIDLDEILDMAIKYFEYIEDYKKCQELLDIKNNKNEKFFEDIYKDGYIKCNS